MRKITVATSSVLGTLLFFCLMIFSRAEDGVNGGGGEFEISNLAEALAVGGIVTFALGAFVGLLVFFNQKKGVHELMNELGIQVKYAYKIHHPITLLSLLLWVLHGIVVTSSGVVTGMVGIEFIGWAAVVCLFLLCLTGFFFKIAKDFRPKLRIIHLLLMILTAIFLGIHAATTG
jgi:hypothetical protein